METIPERTFRFGVLIVRLVAKLPKDSTGFALASQLVRSGTSVGANVEEVQSSGSKKDFVRGMTIALKEARETVYWLRVLGASGVLAQGEIELVLKENLEIVKILTVSVKRVKEKL